jgi:lipopolysaccharide transport system ATP-binding protein
LEKNGLIKTNNQTKKGMMPQFNYNPEQSQYIKQLNEEDGRFGNKKVEIISFGIFDEDEVTTDALTSGKKYKFIQQVRANEDIDYLSTGMVIRNPKSVDIFGVTNKTSGLSPNLILKRGQIINIVFELDIWLAAGDYVLLLANAGEDDVQYDCIQSAMQFTVIGTQNLFTTSIVNLCPKVMLQIIDK